MFPFSRAKRSTIAPGESFDYRTGTSRSQRELDIARDSYRNALENGDRQLIGKEADNYNRAINKFNTQTGLAARTDEDLVEEFNALRALAAHNRSIGGDYLGPTRNGLKLVPELNRRGITRNYYPTIDDFTYTQVADYDRLRHESKRYGAKAMEAAANNDLREYNTNIELSRSFGKKADSNFGGIRRAQGIGDRTYTGIKLKNKNQNSLRPLTSNIPQYDSNYDSSQLIDFNIDDLYIEVLPQNTSNLIPNENNPYNLVRIFDKDTNYDVASFRMHPSPNGVMIDGIYRDNNFSGGHLTREIFKKLGDSARSKNVPVFFNNYYSYSNGKRPGLRMLENLMNENIVGYGGLKNSFGNPSYERYFYLRKNGGKL